MERFCLPRQQQQLQQEKLLQQQQKRPRKNNWRTDETLSLVRLYKEKAAIIHGGFSVNKCTVEAKVKAWEEMCRSLAEAHPTGPRSVKESQRRWQAVQSVAGANISAFIQQGAEKSR